MSRGFQVKGVSTARTRGETNSKHHAPTSKDAEAIPHNPGEHIKKNTTAGRAKRDQLMKAYKEKVDQQEADIAQLKQHHLDQQAHLEAQHHANKQAHMQAQHHADQQAHLDAQHHGASAVPGGGGATLAAGGAGAGGLGLGALEAGGLGVGALAAGGAAGSMPGALAAGGMGLAETGIAAAGAASSIPNAIAAELMKNQSEQQALFGMAGKMAEDEIKRAGASIDAMGNV